MTDETRLNVSAHLAGRNALAEAGYTPAQIQKFFYMRELFENAALAQSQLNKEARRDGNVT